MRSGFPSAPPSRPPPYRQLGSGGQQPVRLQMIIGLVVGLVLVAVPLYLWRRPERVNTPLEGAGGGAGSAGGGDASAALSGAATASAAPPPRLVKLSPFKTIRCQDRGPGKTPPERCDHITYFEDALARALRENVQCAPTSSSGATVSVVMDFSFRRRKLKIYRGKSSNVSKAASKELFACILRAMPTPTWGSIAHQHSRYVVNVSATFPPSTTF